MHQRLVGYSRCHRGLNNQKLALLGLVAICRREGSSLAIPQITHFDPETASPSGYQPFSEVFDLALFQQYLSKLDIQYTHGEKCDSVEVREAFALGNAQDIRARTEFLEALRPSRNLLDLINMAADRAYPSKPRVALQLRIERDWVEYAQERLRAIPQEDNLLSGFEIIDKLARTLQITSVYVTCDERALTTPREELSAYALDKYGIRLIWKADVQPDALPLSQATEFDFHMARIADVFIGTSRSTFANLLCSAAPDATHYLYNQDKPDIIRRTDYGMYPAAIDATRNPIQHYGI